MAATKKRSTRSGPNGIHEVYPSVLDSFERGRTIDRQFGSVAELVASGRRLRRSERALLKLLQPKAA